MIKIIVACDEKNVIGKNNQLIWHLPADLKHFKNLTSGHSIIMGRKTFDSIGKALPNRNNLVVSRQSKLNAEGIILCQSLDEAILKAQSLSRSDVFIIGGAEIYKQAMERADQIILTRLHDYFDGDTYFPEITSQDWEIIQTERGITDEKNPYQYSFLTYQRKV
ncbi:dihydrofolate reductase [Aquirufa sp. Wall-65K1]